MVIRHDRAARRARQAGAVVALLALGLPHWHAGGAEAGRIGLRSVIPGSTKECLAPGPCKVPVPVRRTAVTPAHPYPCAIDGLVETVLVRAPMLVLWDIEPAAGDTSRYRFSAGRGVRFVQPSAADPLPADSDFTDPDFQDAPFGDFVNPRGYRWRSGFGSSGLNKAFHYEINLLVWDSGKWQQCNPADPKIVNKS